MGFNTQLRKALDDQLAPRHRFAALRGAVERFSPNGFNATFANLQQAVNVSDPDNWTAAEIAQAAETLGRSRTHYMQHRARWDDDRRTRKALGLHVPSREDSDTFNDRSWFDDISFSSKGRHRWVRLGEWIRASGVTPTALGPDLEGELRETLERIPPARFEPMGSMLAHYGPFPSPFELANVIAIPYRVYNDPIADSDCRAASSSSLTAGTPEATMATSANATSAGSSRQKSTGSSRTCSQLSATTSSRSSQPSKTSWPRVYNRGHGTTSRTATSLRTTPTSSSWRASELPATGTASTQHRIHAPAETTPDRSILRSLS